MRKVGRFLAVSAQRFYVDGCLMRASALAYVSLLSLVPLLAVMFSVLKGLGVQRRLEPLLLSRLSLQAETTEAIIGYIDRTNFSRLGALGAVGLLFTIYSLLGSIEASFNRIWRVARDRSYVQQLTHYSGVVLLTPFLLLAAVALTSSLQIEQLVRWVRDMDIVSDFVVALLGAAPVLLNIAALAVLYTVMPNRRPFVPSVLLGAVAAGVGWHIVQVTYLRFQIGVSRYNAIYGALSQLPITLVWQYVSWLIVLAGAELAAVYEFGIDAADRGVARTRRLAIALELLVRGAHSFSAATRPLAVRDVARDLGVPLPRVADVAAWLGERGWLVAVQDHDGEYVLAMDPRHVRLGSLTELLPTAAALPRSCSGEAQRAWSMLAAAQQSGWDQFTLADVLATQSDDHSEQLQPPS